ncbi:hypothetical protein [Ensifer sp. KUDG1]|uniref:hypothetical protein n=1 Tax=Ensifer sp. KUDG1 TaxID=3373919 RepID=UPI003D1C0324
MADNANTVYRDFVTDGVPSSGKNRPKKADIRRLLTGYEAIINAFVSNGGLIYSSKAALDADLAHGANSMAWVIGDATVGNNGVYRKNGASGAGSWTRVADLPFSFIIASDVGAGTPNAIQATTSIPVSGSALVWTNIFEANTASPVTISFNGGAALTIKTNTGNNVATGGLVAGMIVLGIVSGSTFRLLSDQVSAAIVAQAEAAAAAAVAAANSINQRIYSSVSLAAADTISSIVKRVRTQFYNPNYAVPATLVGGANYRRISFASLTGFPAAAFFRSLDRFMPDGATDNTNGGYWVIDEVIYNPEMFGAVQDFNGTTGTNAATALNAMIATAKLLVVPMKLRAGKGYYSASGLTATNMSFTMTGDGFGTSSVVFNNVGDGLVITQDDYKHPTSLEGFSLVTIRQEPGTALNISYSKSDSITNRNMARCLLKDIECRGHDVNASGWLRGIELNNVHRPEVIRPKITGRKNLLATGPSIYSNMVDGIKIFGDPTPTMSSVPSEQLIDAPKIDHSINAISSNGEVEGLKIRDPEIIAAGIGVYASYSTTRPFVSVRGGHIYAFTNAISFQNAPQSVVDGILVYKPTDANADTNSIFLNNCDDSRIVHMELQNQSASAGAGGQFNGIVIQNSKRCVVRDIKHVNPSKTVILSGTTDDTVVDDLLTFGVFPGATVQEYDDSSSGTNNRYTRGNKQIANVTNPALVNLADTTPAAVAQTVTLTVNKGERYLVTGNIAATKGGTGGQFLTQLSRILGGGAAASWGATGGTTTVRNDYAASASIGQSAAGILNITASGTVVIQLVATVTGSVATVAANASQLSVVAL